MPDDADNNTSIDLKVAEAIQDDVNKGIVRIDSNYMKDLGVREGYFVEIEGEQSTIGIADRALPGDIGLNIIRMDGLLRRNSRSSIGEEVAVSKADVEEADKVVIAPSKEGLVVSTNNPNIFKIGLLGRPVSQGDVVSLGGTPRRMNAMTDVNRINDIFGGIKPEDAFGGIFGLADMKFVVLNTEPTDKPVVITEDTEIEYRKEGVAPDQQNGRGYEVSYEDIGGLDDEIKKIREMVELPLKHPEVFQRLGIEPPKGVMLHGPPGTGKTLLAKAVANETNSNFYVINGPEIMSKFYGESEANLRNMFEEAEENSPSIIFIDEIDAIAPKREESKGEVERRVVAQLLSLMDGLEGRGKVVVIAATNIPNSVDPALRRPGRFDRELEIGVPQVEGREKILQIHTRNMPLDDNVNLHGLAENTHGFVGADLESLTKEAAMNVLRRLLPELQLDEDEAIDKDTLDKLTIHSDDFKEAMKSVRPSALREVFIETPEVTWEDVGGLNTVKQELQEAVEWPLSHKDDFTRLGVKPPKGVLLYGPPGTGKTLMAKAVANESNANFLAVKGPELLSKWVGESEKAVREVFKKARQASPTVVFFDELDSIAPKRGGQMEQGGGDGGNTTERIVNQLLTEMDGMQDLADIVIVGATNRPDILDTALLRPGRFDRILLAGSPDEESREAIFEIHTRDMPLADDVTIDELVRRTEGYVGADIESVCREAAILALRDDMDSAEVNMEYFKEALDKVPPSITDDVMESYEDMKDRFRSAAGKQMQDERPSYYG